MAFTKKNRNQRQAKGNQLQIDSLKVHMQFQPEHEGLIESVPINQRGEDWIMLDEARYDYPYSVDCKQDDRGFSRVYESFEQAKKQCMTAETDLNVTPLLLIRQGKNEILSVVRQSDWERLNKLVKDLKRLGRELGQEFV